MPVSCRYGFCGPTTPGGGACECELKRCGDAIGELYIKIPATQAVSHEAKALPILAFKPIRAKSERRSGAMALMPPIWMPIEEKLANPHKA